MLKLATKPWIDMNLWVFWVCLIVFWVSLSLWNALMFHVRTSSSDISRSNDVFLHVCHQGTRAPTAVGKCLCPLEEPRRNKIRDVWQGHPHRPPWKSQNSAMGATWHRLTKGNLSNPWTLKPPKTNWWHELMYIYMYTCIYVYIYMIMIIYMLNHLYWLVVYLHL